MRKYLLAIPFIIAVFVGFLALNSKEETTIVNHKEIAGANPKTLEVVEVKLYDERDLDLLAHLINGEAGATYCSDTMRYYVGSVVLNRMQHELFPDTIENVIYDDGQYACTWDGNFDKEPTEKCYEVSRDLLINGSRLPKNVIYQAGFEQGSGVYFKEQNMYFCY